MLSLSIGTFVGGLAAAIIGFYLGHVGRNDEVARLKGDVADLEKAVVHWKATAHVLSASVQELRQELARSQPPTSALYCLAIGRAGTRIYMSEPWSLS